MCSETSEAVGTTWEHAQLEFQKFLKIRIPLIVYGLHFEICWHERIIEKYPHDIAVA